MIINGINIKFMGTNSLAFTFEGRTVLIDPYFSRPPGVLGPGALMRKFQPDEGRIEWALSNFSIEKADAIAITHSHIDHAMDMPTIAKKTGATIYGSSSTANIARGLDLSEDRIVIVEPQGKYSIPPFTLSFHKSAHIPIPPPLDKLLENKEIDQPLIPPARVFDYKEGDVYVIKIEVTETRFAIYGSAGPLPDSLKGKQIDYVFASIGGLQTKPISHTDDYINGSILSLNPRKTYLTHWDLFTRPLSTTLRNLPMMAKIIDRFKERLGDGVLVMGVDS